MKKNDMIVFGAIILVSCTCAIVLNSLKKKPRSSYPKKWIHEANEAVEWTKNYLQEQTK